MFGNTAQTDVLDPPRSPSLRIVLSAQAIGELTVLCYPADSSELAKRELAGFLFGRLDEGSVLIETVRQLPSEEESSIFDAFTPKQFDETLRSGREDKSLETLQLLGWYRFHPGGDLRLEPRETIFHERFFHGHEQIGLIIRPDEPAALTIMVCARSQDGTFSRTQHCSAVISVNSRRISRAAVELQSGPKFGEEAYINAYRILEGAEQRQTKRKRLLLVGSIVAVLGVAAIVLRSYSESPTVTAVEQKAPALSLTLSADGPNLLVSWMGGASLPKVARLKVFDGDAVTDMDLTKSYNPTGSVTVPRHSGNVQAFITVNDGFRTWQSQSTLIDEGFAANQKAHAALASVSKVANEQTEVTRLKEKNMRLQSTINALQREIEYAPHRTHK